MSTSDIEFMYGLVAHLDDTYNNRIRQSTDLLNNIINTLITSEKSGLTVDLAQLQSQLFQVRRLLNN